MSYFRRIIKRTVGGSPGIIKPVISPESIPEYPAGVEPKVGSAASTRRPVPAAEKTLKAPGGVRDNKQAISEDTIVPKPEIARHDTSIEPNANQENTDKAPSLESGQERRIASRQGRGISAQTDNPLPAVSFLSPEKLPERGPEATLQPSNPRTRVMAEYMQARAKMDHGLQAQTPEDTPKPEASPQQFSITGQPEYGENPNQDYVLVELQSKADETRQDEPGMGAHLPGRPENAHPGFQPSIRETRYPSVARQPPETVVTVNIGRIEVRAFPQEARSKKQAEFSPPLSLEEYLKQRAKR